MHILNTDFFGYIMQNEKYKDINEASEKFFNFKFSVLGKPLQLITGGIETHKTMIILLNKL